MGDGIILLISLQMVLTRKNTITGIEYRDDPTIFGWELINEPRCMTDPSGDTLQVSFTLFLLLLSYCCCLVQLFWEIFIVEFSSLFSEERFLLLFWEIFILICGEIAGLVRRNVNVYKINRQESSLDYRS